MTARPEPEDELGDDVLEIGHAPPAWIRRVGDLWRRLRYGTPLVICAAVAVAGVFAWRTLDSAPTPQSMSKLVHHAPRASFDSGPLLAVRGLARHEGPLLGYVRQTSPAGACALVAPGHSPLPLIGRALHRFAPRYRVLDSAMVLDEFTGLCSIEVRAVNPAHDVLVVSVAAPPVHTAHSAFARVQTGVKSGPRSTTKYALDVSTTGFRILVGATGPPRGLPRAQDLVTLASQPALTW